MFSEKFKRRIRDSLLGRHDKNIYIYLPLTQDRSPNMILLKNYSVPF